MAHKSHNDEFKTQAARLVSEQGYVVKLAAQSLGVDQCSIRHWVRKFAPIPAPLTRTPRLSNAIRRQQLA